MDKYGQIESQLKEAGAKNVTRRKIRKAVDAKIANSPKVMKKDTIIEAPAVAAAPPPSPETKQPDTKTDEREPEPDPEPEPEPVVKLEPEPKPEPEPELEPEPEPGVQIETIVEVLEAAKAGWGAKFAGAFSAMGIHNVQVKKHLTLVIPAGLPDADADRHCDCDSMFRIWPRST